MSGLFLVLIILGIFFGCIELSHRLRAHSPLQLETFDWKITETDFGLKLTGCLVIENPHPRMEVMVPELEAKPILLGKEGVDEIRIKTNIIWDYILTFKCKLEIQTGPCFALGWVSINPEEAIIVPALAWW